MAESASGERAIEYQVKEKKRAPFLVDLFTRLIKTKPLGTAGLVVFVGLFVVGILADVLAPFGYNEMILGDRLQPPSPGYVLGTDDLGRDLLSRIIYGARISMLVTLFASLLDVGIAGLIGLTSGFFGGKFDLFMQRFVDGWICFPGLFVYLTVMSLTGPGLLQVILVLGIASGIGSSRVVRSAVIAIKENVYVESAKAIGAPNSRILLRHILPNIMAPIIILFSLAASHMIIQEATLSFLGFGIPPPVPSWGGMLSGSGREFMLIAPWMAIWPGVALGIVVYGTNMLGDAMRDLLDPRLRGGLGRYEKVRRKMPSAAK